MEVRNSLRCYAVWKEAVAVAAQMHLWHANTSLRVEYADRSAIYCDMPEFRDLLGTTTRVVWRAFILMLTGSSMLDAQSMSDSLLLRRIVGLHVVRESSVDLTRPFTMDLLPKSQLTAGFIPSDKTIGNRELGVTIDGHAWTNWMRYASGLYTEESYRVKNSYLMRSQISAQALVVEDKYSRLQLDMNVNRFRRFGPSSEMDRASGMLVGSELRFGFQRFELTKETAWNTGRRMPGASEFLFNTSLGYSVGPRSRVLLRWSNYSPGLYRFYHPLWEAGFTFGQ